MCVESKGKGGAKELGGKALERPQPKAVDIWQTFHLFSPRRHKRGSFPWGHYSAPLLTNFAVCQHLNIDCDCLMWPLCCMQQASITRTKLNIKINSNNSNSECNCNNRCLFGYGKLLICRLIACVLDTTSGGEELEGGT